MSVLNQHVVYLKLTEPLYVNYISIKPGGKILEKEEQNPDKSVPGHLGSSVVERLPLAQVVILESSDQVPHHVPHRKPASPSAYLFLSLMNK